MKLIQELKLFTHWSVCKISSATCWFLIKSLYEIFAQRHNKTFTGTIKSAFDIWHFKHSFASKMSAMIQPEYFFFFMTDRQIAVNQTVVPHFFKFLFYCSIVRYCDRSDTCSLLLDHEAEVLHSSTKTAAYFPIWAFTGQHQIGVPSW